MESLRLPLIFLLTPQHTGTHFVRMLLETHSRISFGVPESRRIDRSLRPGYRLAGNGVGPEGPENEGMLDEYAVRRFHGELTADQFLRCITYCLSQRAQTTADRTVYEELKRIAVKDFRILGLELPEKDPAYLLFHGHCGPKYELASFADSAQKLVVTLRHPLLAVLSALRRTNDPEVARNILCAFDLVLRIPRAHFFCVDLAEHDTERALEVFSYLDLEPEDLARNFLEKSPHVNRTITADLKPSSVEERESTVADPRTLEQLRAARQLLLEEGRIAPVLAEWWKAAQALQLPARLRSFGYDF